MNTHARTHIDQKAILGSRYVSYPLSLIILYIIQVISIDPRPPPCHTTSPSPPMVIIKAHCTVLSRPSKSIPRTLPTLVLWSNQTILQQLHPRLWACNKPWSVSPVKPHHHYTLPNHSNPCTVHALSDSPFTASSLSPCMNQRGPKHAVCMPLGPPVTMKLPNRHALGFHTRVYGAAADDIAPPPAYTESVVGTS